MYYLGIDVHTVCTYCKGITQMAASNLFLRVHLLTKHIYTTIVEIKVTTQSEELYLYLCSHHRRKEKVVFRTSQDVFFSFFEENFSPTACKLLHVSHLTKIKNESTAETVSCFLGKIVYYIYHNVMWSNGSYSNNISLSLLPFNLHYSKLYCPMILDLF